MIPSVVGHQVGETILDYLRTTFSLADEAFERALFDFLDSENGLFKGPYVDVRLPFRKADLDERIPLDVRPGFAPYKHRLKAGADSAEEGGRPAAGEPGLSSTTPYCCGYRSRAVVGSTSKPAPRLSTPNLRRHTRPNPFRWSSAAERVRLRPAISPC